MKYYEKFNVEPRVLKWAISESEISEDDILKKFPTFNKWLSKEMLPSTKQLQDFANFTKVPYGFMFLSNPPEKSNIEVDFRSFDNKIPKISKNLKDTLSDIQLKQDWLRDERKALGWDNLSLFKYFDELKNTNIDNKTLCLNVKKEMGLDPYWFKKFSNYKDAFSYLRNLFSNNGITVIQNGIVIGNNNRKLNIQEFRAFALEDEIAPFIFINNNDSYSGKIFSLVHELFHLLYHTDDIIIDMEPNNYKDLEKNINSLTQEFLMPHELIINEWDTKLQSDNLILEINELSSLLKVSPIALAITLKKTNLISQDVVDKIKFDSNAKVKKRTNNKNGGGNYYNTLISRVSPPFIHSVFSSVSNGNTTYTEAFRLLNNLNYKTYSNLRKEMSSNELYY